MKKIIITILLSVFFSASFADYGYYADAFMLAGKSSQSIAMGGTGLTSINGIISVITNPAGLAGYDKKEIYTQYNNLFGLATQNSIGYSRPFGNYQIGLLLNTVGVQLYYREDIVNDIPNINERREYVRQALNLETFYDLETALLFSIARETPIDIKLGWSYDRFTIYFQYGLNVKLLYKSLNNSSAIGGGVDIGARLLIPGNEVFYIKKLGTISMGLNLENIIQSPVIWFDHLNDYGNMRITGGVALHQPIKFLESNLIFALDGYIFESQFFPDYGVRYGIQWTYRDFIDVRFGKDLSSYTAGAGIYIPVGNGKLKIDYSIQNHEINWSHLISLSYYWGDKK
jgi:hypothetical protein